MEDIVPVASILTILGAPHLPTFGIGYGYVEHIAMRLFLVVAVIYAIRLGPMSGLLAFLAAFTLLIERNHEVLTTLPDQQLLAKVPSVSYGLPIQVASLIPEKDTYLFESNDEHGKEVVETHGETTTTKEYETTEDINDSNPRIESVPGSYSESPGFFNRLAN